MTEFDQAEFDRETNHIEFVGRQLQGVRTMLEEASQMRSDAAAIVDPRERCRWQRQIAELLGEIEKDRRQLEDDFNGTRRSMQLILERAAKRYRDSLPVAALPAPRPAVLVRRGVHSRQPRANRVARPPGVGEEEEEELSAPLGGPPWWN